jgi:hypothetical protein
VSLAAEAEAIALTARDELLRACRRFERMHSPHEAIAVIHEEFRELRRHVYGNTGRSPEAMVEAIQLAAMALRYVLDLAETP